MKKVAMMVAVMLFGTTSLVMAAKDSTASFKVSGNCGMCKTRIEKTAKAAGATTAVWTVSSQTLKVTFSPKKTTSDKIQEKVAVAGHDTPKFKSTEEAYDKLPGCCQYDRENPSATAH
jgi:mercuric ion binding protein